jgi:RNA polymerase-binding transcription factor DksA
MDPKRARKRLEEERARLERVREGLLADPETTGDATGVGELSTYDQHPADVGTEVFEHEKNQALLEQVEAQLRDIDDAFKRLEEGTYGLSVLSGEPISDERLEAVPWTRYTVQEQARAESMGRT